MKRKFVNLYIRSFSTILYAISNSDTSLRSRKSISKPNFDKISQSKAEMNYFRFIKNGHPPYWISISGFYFDVCVDIGVSFYICVTNFAEIGRSAAEF